MQRYGDGEFVLYKDARKEISSLKAKNKQLTAELRDVEYQRDQYHEAAHRHRGEVQRLLHDAIEPLKAERDALRAENKRLREALREIGDCDSDGIDLQSPQELARAALQRKEGG